MTLQKRKAMYEPLLNTVARKLGHAAGTLAKATQELTESLSAIPENVTGKVRESAHAAPVRSSGARTRHPRKRMRRLTRTQATAGSKSQKPPKSKSPRSGRTASNLKK